MFLLTLLACPAPPLDRQSHVLTDSDKDAVIAKEKAKFPDAISDLPTQSGDQLYGDCVDCNNVEPNLILRQICEGMGCTP